MRECSKSILRRMNDPSFMLRYFRGRAIDIGGAPDPLSLYVELFPRLESVRVWDRTDGDAQQMFSLSDDQYDLVHSSHCLEHLVDPREGLANWLRICRPGGFVVFTVPDEDLYEQGVFPSTMNRDHKWTFTIHKHHSWSHRSLNVLELLRDLGPTAAVERVQLVDSTYRYSLPRYDQTLAPIAECAIEVIIRKRGEAELAAGGRLPGTAQPSAELRIHLNQYRDDLETLKSTNASRPPFTNEQEL